MFFESIKIKNIGPIRNLELSNLNELYSPILVVGDNRVGKSTLVDCMAYSLMGSFPSKGGSTSNRVTWGEKDGSVEAVVEFNGNRYTIVRNIKADGSGQTGEVWLNGEMIAGPLVTRANDFIKETIIDPTMLLMTNFSSQFRKKDFTETNPAERKKILADMIGLDFDGFYTRFREYKKVLDKKSEIEQGRLEALADVPEDHFLTVEELGNIENDIENIYMEMKTLKEKNEDIESDLERLDVDTQKYNKIASKVKELSNTIKRIEKFEEEYGGIEVETIDAQVQTYQNNINKLKKARAEYEKERRNVQQEINRTEDQIKRDQKDVKTLDIVPCGDKFPSCPFITDAHDAKHRLSKCPHVPTEFKDNLEKIENKIDAIDKKLDTINDQLHDLLQAQAMIRSTPEILQYDECMEEYERLRAKISTQEKDDLIIRKEAITDRRKELRNIETLLNQKLVELNNLKGRAEVAQEQRDQISKNKQAIELKIGEISEEQKVWEMIVSGFGPNGAQPLILEMSIPEICEIANELLGVMSEDPLQTNITTTTELASKKETRETLLIEVIHSDGRISDISECSGAEQSMVRTALRSALAVFNIRKTGGPPFFVGDEMFGAYDPAHNANAMKMFNQLSEFIPQIFLISHQVETFSGANTVLKLFSDNGNVEVSYE